MLMKRFLVGPYIVSREELAMPKRPASWLLNVSMYLESVAPQLHEMEAPVFGTLSDVRLMCLFHLAILELHPL